MELPSVIECMNDLRKLSKFYIPVSIHHSPKKQCDFWNIKDDVYRHFKSLFYSRVVVSHGCNGSMFRQIVWRTDTTAGYNFLIIFISKSFFFQSDITNSATFWTKKKPSGTWNTSHSQTVSVQQSTHKTKHFVSVEVATHLAEQHLQHISWLLRIMETVLWHTWITARHRRVGGQGVTSWVNVRQNFCRLHLSTNHAPTASLALTVRGFETRKQRRMLKGTNHLVTLKHLQFQKPTLE